MSNVAYKSTLVGRVSPDDAHIWWTGLRQLQEASQEQARVFFLGATQEVLVAWELSDGLEQTVALSTTDVLRYALMIGATGLALAHNHPSGDPQPSRADIALTRQLAQGCRALGLKMVDHVILTERALHSMRLAGQI
jgi:DNA repair protein RadC